MPRDRFEALLARETTRLPPTVHGIIAEDNRLALEARLQAFVNNRYAGLTPAEIKAKLTGLRPGVEDCLRNVAKRDRSPVPDCPTPNHRARCCGRLSRFWAISSQCLTFPAWGASPD